MALKYTGAASCLCFPLDQGSIPLPRPYILLANCTPHKLNSCTSFPCTIASYVITGTAVAPNIFFSSGPSPFTLLRTYKVKLKAISLPQITKEYYHLQQHTHYCICLLYIIFIHLEDIHHLNMCVQLFVYHYTTLLHKQF